MKKITASLTALVLMLTGGLPVYGVEYFPDVTEEMARAAYWSDRQEDPTAILAAPEEIRRINQAAYAAEGTYLADLKQLPEVFDGIAENEKVLQEARENRDWLLGWTYDSTGAELTEEDFDALIAACDDPAAKREMRVRYAVAAVRTAMLVYPTDEPILDDPADLDFDYRYNTGLRVNEPLLLYTVSADGRWYYARGTCLAGWVRAEDVAVCADRAEWLGAWDIPENRLLVVYGDKVYTEASNNAPETANRLLTMGTTLELGKAETPASLVGNRVTWHNYVVYLPVRRADGSYEKQQTLIPATKKVHAGYLPLTKENIAAVAFEALGTAYGWGGMLLAEDCSGYVCSIYKCFGLELARNTTWQELMPVAGRDISFTSNEEKRIILDGLPLGSVLFFNGHEMLYLGSENGRYYVINAASSMMNPWDAAARQRSRVVAVNTLDARRTNGKSWLSELSYINVPYLSADTPLAPDWAWYHAGVAYCLDNGLMEAEDGEFRVYDAVTRRELLEALWRFAGAPEKRGEMPFSDVPADASYSAAVRWAAEAGIAEGCRDGDFQPERPVTREELAAALYRLKQALLPEPDAAFGIGISDYADAEAVSEWARDAMEWARGAGLIYGTAPDILSPGETATRAQLAAVLFRMMQAEPQRT